MVPESSGAFCAEATCGSTALSATDLSSSTSATKRGLPALDTVVSLKASLIPAPLEQAFIRETRLALRLGAGEHAAEIIPLRIAAADAFRRIAEFALQLGRIGPFELQTGTGARDRQHLMAAMLDIDTLQHHLLDRAAGKDNTVMAHDRDFRLFAERGGERAAELRRVDIFRRAGETRRRLAGTRDRAQRLGRRA